MRRLLLVTALSLCASVAPANDGLFYFGAGITSNNVNSIQVQGLANLVPNINSTSWQVFAGIRPISLFAVEADYLDLGSQAKTFQTPLSCVSVGSCATAWDSDAKAFAGYALGFLPIPLPHLDVYGKAGLARYKLNRSITSYNSGGMPNGYSAYPDNSTVFTWARAYRRISASSEGGWSTRASTRRAPASSRYRSF
jgi:hypothetical protein